jgi:Kef-type K+ transport system membrane component KefB
MVLFWRLSSCILLLILAAQAAEGPSTASEGHGAAIVTVLFGFIVMLLSAKLGGELMERLGQPAVLGELAAGMVLGNLVLAGVPWFEVLKSNETLALMAEMGVILLLFQVGLESHMTELLAVGASAILVANVGVVLPMMLGYGVSLLFLPQEAWYVHLFAGATLTATSVGITARVLRDLKKMETKEARIILGAAVVDDVLGLIVLAVVAGMVQTVSTGGGTELNWGPAGLIVLKAAAFLAGAVIVGRLVHVNALKMARYFRVEGITLALAICFCFTMAGLAGLVGLAPIVGAFAAGLVLEDDDYEVFHKRGIKPIEELIQPIATVLVPIFFVMMGLKVDLRAFGSLEVLGLAALITVAAVLGKQICALGVIDKGVDRIAVGLGMIPRGEVGLIFVGIGASLMVSGRPVFGSQLVSAMVVMVMLTTVMTPPLLKWAFTRKTPQ